MHLQAIAILKEIYDAIRYEAEMQPLAQKIKELLSATEEQTRKIELAKKLVEQAPELNKDTNKEDLLFADDDSEPRASAASAAVANDDDYSEDQVGERNAMPLIHIEERPAPPPPPDSDDDDVY